MRITALGVEIVRTGADQPVIWPYASLATAVPLSAKAHDVLISSSSMKDATLFVASAAFVAALAPRAPHITTQAQRWRFARPLLAIAAGFVVIIATVWALDLSPARAIAGLMPDSVRSDLGSRVVASMIGKRRVCSASEGRAALDALAERLKKAGNLEDQIRIVVVDWGLVNAFAAPGEQIVLTRALIEAAGSPDEVAGVLAHEIGHGIERHPETGIVRVIGLTAAAELMFGGGGTLSNIGVVLAQFSYTREAERQADAHALNLLREAGIATKGIVDFFKRVEKRDGDGPTGAIDILRTHPQIPERMKRAAEQTGYLTTPALDARQWQALRSICRT